MMKKIVFLILLINSLGYGAQIKQNSIESRNTSGEKKQGDYTYEYVIRKGDNLYKLSKKFNISVNELIRMNKIENPNLIYMGDKLKVKSELAELGKKYELIGDSIWMSDKIDLKYRLSKSLNSYEVAKQLYKKSGVEYGIEIELKIVKINYLKDALRLENLGNIYYVKDQKIDSMKKYKEMLKRLDLYQDLERRDEKSISDKIERVEKILEEEGEKYERKNI